MKSKEDSSKKIIIPFLKWAGGKRWLTSSYPELFPKTFNNYLEPFLGSGAVFFHIQPKKSILGDMNSELIETYASIQQNWHSVYKHLKTFHRKHSNDFYYDIRKKQFRLQEKKAARFIYLNRTCWNGLYRVNLDGKFNVPKGTKRNVILNTDDFASISTALSNTELLSTDFATIIGKAKRDDFLFVDPPYTVRHNHNGFVKYNDTLFSWEDQIRLRDDIECAVSKGVKVLLTNADHKSVRDLYKGIGQIKKINRLSAISGNVASRGNYSEIVVKSY